jgi:DNA-binding response OmpR family regulator
MSKKVLIADDEPNILISLEFLMKREGWQVSVARDGVEALSAIQTQRPDLVLLDVMMPGKTGLDRKSTRLNSSHNPASRMPSSA